MSRFVEKTAILFGVCLLALAGVGTILADEDVKSRGKMSWTVIDEDGTEHKETVEFDGPRPFLGVGLERVRDGGGARIDSVEKDSAAEAAGLREGDVIVGYDGEAIETPWDLTRAVLESEPGDRVDIEIERDGSRQVVRAELGEREDWVGAFSFGEGDFDFDFNFDFEGFAERMEELGTFNEERMESLRETLERHRFDSEEFQQRMEKLGESLENMRLDFDFSPDMQFRFGGKPRLGVELVGVTGDLREHLGANRDEGVLVGRVLEDTPAEDAGVEVGDLIVAVGGEQVGSQGDLHRLLRERDGETFGLDVIRDGRPVALSVSLPDRDDGPVAPGRYFRRHTREEPAEST
jgi:C-terminal processing protease CtpA/Prc